MMNFKKLEYEIKWLKLEKIKSNNHYFTLLRQIRHKELTLAFKKVYTDKYWCNNTKRYLTKAEILLFGNKDSINTL